MPHTTPNPIDVFETLAQEHGWYCNRSDACIYFQATLKSQDEKKGLLKINWFEEETILTSAAIWPYTDANIENLQMHRATAEINQNIWEGTVFWHEATKNIVIRVVRNLPGCTLSIEDAAALHMLPFTALQQTIATFDSFAYGSNAYTKTLIRAESQNMQ